MTLNRESAEGVELHTIIGYIYISVQHGEKRGRIVTLTTKNGGSRNRKQIELFDDKQTSPRNATFIVKDNCMKRNIFLRTFKRLVAQS